MLDCQYLGIPLPHPFLVGASPLVYDLDEVMRLEDAGAAAVVMHSLFAEQFTKGPGAGRLLEDTRYFVGPAGDFPLHPESYLEHLRRMKERLRIPVIASLNGQDLGDWLKFGLELELAGADALELNLYGLPGTGRESAAAVEERAVEMIRQVKMHLGLPVAVKLSPAFSALGEFVTRLETTGIQGIVLFNKLFLPDIDIERLRYDPRSGLGATDSLQLRLWWAATLFGRTPFDLALTGGVRSARDAVKAFMAGATVVQLVSCLLMEGPSALTRMISSFRDWMEAHAYEDLDKLRGILSFIHEDDPGAVARSSYFEVLQGWNPEPLERHG